MWYADPDEIDKYPRLPDCEVEGCPYDATEHLIRPSAGLMMKSGSVTLLRTEAVHLCPWHADMMRRQSVEDYHRQPDGTFGRCAVNGCGDRALILVHDPEWLTVRRARPLCEHHAGVTAPRPDYRYPNRDEGALDRIARSLMADYNERHGSRIDA